MWIGQAFTFYGISPISFCPIFSTETDKRTKRDESYVPTAWEKRQMQKKPDRIPLPDGMSRKGLLHATTAAATRFGLSSSAHLGMVASTINAAGGNMQDVVASLPSAKRHRKATQAEIARKVKDDFINDCKSMKKVLHWDGKVTQFTVGKDKVYYDCNAVVLSVPLSEKKPQFIGAPIVAHGTGELLAQSALHCLDQWEARNDLIGFVFDTTASNTGVHQGAAVRIAEIIARALLWLPCRYHIAELHIKIPYDKLQGPTNGPDDPLFKRFKLWFTKKAQEAKGNNAKFPDPGLFSKWEWDDESPTGPYRSEVTWWARATLTWVREQLYANTFPRGDYRELCEIINITLGGEVILTS